MRLFNQINKPLNWEDGPFSYQWEPYGFADVHPKAVEHVMAQGVPVGPSAVAPELKAAEAFSEAQKEARADEVKRLSNELALSKAAEQSAKDEVERMQRHLDVELPKVAKAEEAQLVLMDELDHVKKERDAYKAQLESTAKKMADAEDVAAKKDAGVPVGTKGGQGSSKGAQK